MKKVVPQSGKVAREARECVQVPFLCTVLRYRGTLYIMITACGIMLLFACIANIAGQMFVCLQIKTKKESTSVN